MQNSVSLMHLQVHPVRSTEQQQAVMLMTVHCEVQDVYIPVCQMHKWCGVPCWALSVDHASVTSGVHHVLIELS